MTPASENMPDILLLITQEPSGMYLKDYNGKKIFRPRPSAELSIHLEAEEHLRTMFAPGIYTSFDDINRIFQHQFLFYERKLSELLPQIASRDFLAFALHQFDCAVEVEKLFRAGQLSSKQAQSWKQLEPTFRRAIKYMAECIVQMQPGEQPVANPKMLLSLGEQVWICAEEMINMYMLSDQTYYICRDDSVLTIQPRGYEEYFKHEVGKDLSDLLGRVVTDVENRSRFVPDPSFAFDLKEHERIIGDSFSRSVGTSYLTAMNFIRQIIDGCRPAAGGFPIPFMHKERTTKNFAAHFNLALPVASKVFDGFFISKTNLESEDPQVWKPKREYRAYRRAFFQFPHATGEHFTFSTSMAREGFLILMKESIFGHFPIEWMDESVKSSLGRLSNAAGSWFEKIVEDNLKQLGFLGVRSATNSIGIGSDQIAIPSDVGEIDYIGYLPSEKLLLISECKLVRDSFEPKYFRDDLQDFIYSDTAYIDQLRRKSSWVYSNLDVVCRALSSCNQIRTPIRPQLIASSVITLLPSIASYFTDEYPCVSITELRMDYERNGHWPYAKGVLHS